MSNSKRARRAILFGIAIVTCAWPQVAARVLADVAVEVLSPDSSSGISPADTAAASDSTRARTLFTTEFGCGVRLGPEIEVGGDPESRATALWDFGPIFRISNNNAAGLLGHISYAGPDNLRPGIMVRWRHYVADRKSLEMSGGLTGKTGGEGGSVIIMGTLNYRDVWLPTLLIQFPTGEESKEPRVFPSFKMGSSAGLLLGTMVPLIVFVAVFVGMSSAS